MRRTPTYGAVVGALVVTGAVLLELQPLRDNSFLTHLATGRLILDTGSVPGSDPYTFTAHGHAWVVQSWLVSALYALLEVVGGLGAIRIFGALLTGAVAALGWRLLRPADGVVARLGVATLMVAIGSDQWAERPLMIGLLSFGLVVLSAEGGLDARWLLPLGWVWANSHGSFPLGLVYLLAVALGSRLDGNEWTPDLRRAGWLGAGVLAGVIGPLGFRVLTFPIELLQRQDVLRHVIEWQAPPFDSLAQRAFLVQVAVAVLLLVRRPQYRDGLPMVVFVASALLGSRNIAVASIVMLPGMARGLTGLGSLSVRATLRHGSAVVALAGVLALLAVVRTIQEPALDLTAYPVDALGYVEGRGVDLESVRMAAPVGVGNLLTFVYGPGHRVFYDDRFDMFPDEVTSAALALIDGRRSVWADLEAQEVDLVLVERTQPIALAVTSDERWRTVYVDDEWQLACRRGAALSSGTRC